MLHLRSPVLFSSCIMAMMAVLSVGPLAAAEPAGQRLPALWVGWCLDNALDPERLIAYAAAARWQALHPGQALASGPHPETGDEAPGDPATVQILPAWEIVTGRDHRRLLASLLVSRSDGVDVIQCSVAGDGSAVDILEHLAQTLDFDSPITIDDRHAGRSYGFDFSHDGRAYQGSLIDLGPMVADRILLSATRF